nr:hypothetical protein [Angustibacter aerolatus]
MLGLRRAADRAAAEVTSLDAAVAAAAAQAAAARAALAEPAAVGHAGSRAARRACAATTPTSGRVGPACRRWSPSSSRPTSPRTRCVRPSSRPPRRSSRLDDEVRQRGLAGPLVSGTDLSAPVTGSAAAAEAATERAAADPADPADVVDAADASSLSALRPALRACPARRPRDGPARGSGARTRPRAWPRWRGCCATPTCSVRARTTTT